MHNETFSIIDIFVSPEYEAFDFKGDLFHYQRNQEDDFIDNEVQKTDILEYIRKHLENDPDQITFIHGDPGIGKSSLTKNLFLLCI